MVSDICFLDFLLSILFDEGGNRKEMFLYEGHVEEEWICNELRMVKKRNTYWAHNCSAAGLNSGLDTLPPKCPALSLSQQQ